MKMQRVNFVRGVLLIFATYFYFLIFAQFAFLEVVRKIDPSEFHVQVVMAAMAVGGLAGSFLVPILLRKGLTLLLRSGLVTCGCAAALIYLNCTLLLPIAVLIGLAVGMTTVALATSLSSIFTDSNWAIGSAVGTGLAYAAANVPVVFQATPELQALYAAVIAIFAASTVPPIAPFPGIPTRPKSANIPETAFAILFFGILVWLDSAAFYVIQHSTLKTGTWGSPIDLWRNAAVHFAAAVGGSYLMNRFRFYPTLAIAFGLLALGGLCANHDESRAFSGWFYPAGVSIYSACLVAFPGFRKSDQSLGVVAVTAAILYAISGWICSGLGIGMAQNLGNIPWQFVAVSTLLLVLPILSCGFWKARREFAYCLLILATATVAATRLPEQPVLRTRIEKGRAVYIAEGCINCHSQFVRPDTRDVLLWGPIQPIERFARDIPPLFGNRRQGPDLMNVGNRRSREWLRIHFRVPRKLAPGSSMPSYDYLFADDRGDSLLDYLLTLKAESPREVAAWTLTTNCPTDTKIELLFRKHCAMCHDTTAETGRLPGVAVFQRPPPNLFSGPFVYAPPNLPSDVRKMQIARIIKFGIPGSDMPGHEYFSDETIFALTRYVEEQSKRR